MSTWKSNQSYGVLSLAVAFVAGFSSCAKKGDLSVLSQFCAQPGTPGVSGSTGSAKIFSPDPISQTGNTALSPTSLSLDSFRTSVTLDHLLGSSVLQGQYVEVRNGLACAEGYLASDPKNQFVYSHMDPRFQEAMAYSWGDRFRAAVDALGYLQPAGAVRVVAHCMMDDNAYFERFVDAHGVTRNKVCLGDSVYTSGASYADDAVVTVHELEHATTVNSYSAAQNLNQFFYDEAGALNEAISDFMAMTFEAPAVSPSLDPRVFSRWALGTFIPNSVNVRGAHRCPVYDSTYPACTGFPGFSADQNTVSYVYPDGIGWAYPNNFAGPGYVRSAFVANRSQEEIHNASVLMTGALWEVYESLKASRGGDVDAGRIASWKLVLEAIRHLPKPSAANRSPVTFRVFAQELLNAGPGVGLLAGEQAALSGVLSARGLVGGTLADPAWGAVGTGIGPAPGLRIIDDPLQLKTWIYRVGGASSQVTQGISTMNGRLDPGETVALWFDLKNLSNLSVGGVLLDVVSQDAAVTFLDSAVNVGAVSPARTQVMYGKIPGSDLVHALASLNSTYSVPIGNSYFSSNPYFDRAPVTAIWAKVSPTAAHGQVVVLRVTATPSNGVATTVDFPVTIQ